MSVVDAKNKTKILICEFASCSSMRMIPDRSRSIEIMFLSLLL